MNANWSWKNSPELMARLNAAQNSPKNCNTDITTFAGMCASEDELRRHVEHYEAKAGGK